MNENNGRVLFFVKIVTFSFLKILFGQFGNGSAFIIILVEPQYNPLT
jgi:hypothetical protein